MHLEFHTKTVLLCFDNIEITKKKYTLEQVHI